jgi:hypothetical protein
MHTSAPPLHMPLQIASVMDLTGSEATEPPNQSHQRHHQHTRNARYTVNAEPASNTTSARSTKQNALQSQRGYVPMSYRAVINVQTRDGYMIV